MADLPPALARQWTANIHNKLNYIYHLPRQLTSSEQASIINHTFKVTFVRHPFVRLVSAYKDKVVDNNYKHWRNMSWRYLSNVGFLTYHNNILTKHAFWSISENQS